jgi:type IV secretory pathway VirB2 component (pilin)
MDNPPTIEDLITSIDGVLEYLVPVASLVAVVFIIIGGYMWMTSAGDPDRVKQAQGTLTWAVIGLIFVLLTGLLVNGLLEYVIGM